MNNHQGQNGLLLRHAQKGAKMPFKGEHGSKTAHNDIRNNPDVIKFLEQCPDIPRPEAKNIKELIPKDEDGDFFERCKKARMPKYIFSLDGSNYEATIDRRYPSRKVGYIKISVVVLNMDHFNEIASVENSKYVDPMKVARLQKDTDCLSFALPGSYVQFPGDNSPYETFRRSLLDNFLSEESRFCGKTLLDSLFELSLKISKAFIDESTGEKYFLVDKCPTRTCGHKEILNIPFSLGYGFCPKCGNRIFATDILRVHEPFTNSGDNTAAFSRTRNVLEHIVLFHYIYNLWRENKNFLSEVGVILDGPLAIFGEGAKFHGALMEIYNEIRVDCERSGLNAPVIIGLVSRY